ncbi:hypothetical protein RCL1_002941 [Eukaryota sp. TZLM3-RCL]
MSSKRRLLAEFYGVSSVNSAKDPLDLSDPYFSDEQYISLLANSSDSKIFITTQQSLEHQAAELQNRLQSVVYDNYAAFLSASKTVKEMHKYVDSVLNQTSNIDSLLSSSSSCFSTISSNLSHVFDDLSSLSQTCCSVKQLSSLLDIPVLMERFLEYKFYGHCISLFISANPVFSAHNSINFISEMEKQLIEHMNQVKNDLLVCSEINSFEDIFHQFFVYSVCSAVNNSEYNSFEIYSLFRSEIIRLIKLSLSNHLNLINFENSKSVLTSTLTEFENSINCVAFLFQLVEEIPNLLKNNSTSVHSLLTQSFLLIDFVKENSSIKIDCSEEVILIVQEISSWIFSEIQHISLSFFSKSLDSLSIMTALIDISNLFKKNSLLNSLPTELFLDNLITFNETVSENFIRKMFNNLQSNLLNLCNQYIKSDIAASGTKNSIFSDFLSSFKSCLTFCHPLVSNMRQINDQKGVKIRDLIQSNLVDSINKLISHCKSIIIINSIGSKSDQVELISIKLCRLVLTLGQSTFPDLFSMIDDVFGFDCEVMENSSQKVYEIGRNLFYFIILSAVLRCQELIEKSISRYLDIKSSPGRPSILIGLLARRIERIYDNFTVFPDFAAKLSNFSVPNLELLSPFEVNQISTELSVENLFHEFTVVPAVNINENLLENFSKNICDCDFCLENDCESSTIKNLIDQSKPVFDLLIDQNDLNPDIDSLVSLFSQSCVCSIISVIVINLLKSKISQLNLISTELYEQIQLDICYLKLSLKTITGDWFNYLMTICNSLIVSCALKVDLNVTKGIESSVIISLADQFKANQMQ